MISGVILARNEETNIEACIHALRPHVSEVFLIDMESEDATVELATPLVERVLHHPLIQNFDSARNLSIPEVNYSWLWFVDADERVSAKTGNIVNELVGDRGDEFEAINIPFKTHFCGKWMQHSGWWPGYTMPRVLKKGYFRFSERLHGGVELSGREIRLPPDPELGIDHFSYLSLEHYIEKFNRYTSTEAAQLHEANQSIDWRNAIAHMMRDLWMYYEGNRGILDGRHGWVLAWLSGQYRWLSHAKLLDVDPNGHEPQAELFPGSLDDVVAIMQQELERLRTDNPALPLGVVWRSPIWDPSGYADEGRCIAKALGQLERHVTLEEIRWSDTPCEVGAEDRALLRSMQRVTRARSNIAITNCIPTLVQPDPAAALNIIRTTFETDRIPEDWMDRLNGYDEIWVISEHNREAFIRSGVAPEKLRCVPSFLDTRLYNPDGPKLELPNAIENRFVFLSVFDWQRRKGWDLLLKAYCRAFASSAGTGLLLKISRAHGCSHESVLAQARQVVSSIGQSLDERNDIVILDEHLPMSKMADLYRVVDAFVLPSRGEGWGRPYMEAMACGLPTIGTAASGNIDFMNDENSILIPAELGDVPDVAAAEIPVYAGHRWFELDIDLLTESLKKMHTDAELRVGLAANGQDMILANHDLDAGKQVFGQAIDKAERRFVRPELDEPDSSKIRLLWEGEFFAGHSFSNINEQFAQMLFGNEQIAIAIDRKFHNPTADGQSRRLGTFQSHFERSFADGNHVVVRHAFPPNWNPPESGRWIHIQPWEFGHLPEAWIEPLQHQVDEIWVPTNYVRRVYEASGISADKIHVVPWGVDPSVFLPEVPARLLPTDRSFRFLFVGGTIHRKGYDRVLEAYTQEFSPDDDVTLVVKDLGSDTFYRFGNLREETINARDDNSMPEVVYFNESWTPGQLASLYVACNCLVMPYRGEGFGLPILEAMACGTPPIVPRGGASDDFVSSETGIMLDSQEVETTHEWPLVGPALELDVDIAELRKAMRSLYENPSRAAEVGHRAAKHVQENFTWQDTLEHAVQRIRANAKYANPEIEVMAKSHVSPAYSRQVSACVRTNNDEATIAACLSSIAPFVDEIVVFDIQSHDRTTAIAREYGARILVVAGNNGIPHGDQLAEFINTDWYFWLEPKAQLSDVDSLQIAQLIKAQPKAATEVSMRIDDAETTGSQQPGALKLIRKPRVMN